MDTFGVFQDIPACWEYVNSGFGVPAGAPGDSAYVVCADDLADTVFAETAVWASALDLSPDGSELVVGALTAVWGGPLGGTNWVFDMDDLSGPVDVIGNSHNEAGDGVGITDGPRGVSWDADGNTYVADFYANRIYHFAYSDDHDDDDIPHVATYYRTLLDLTDTLGGVVQGSVETGWQNKPHGVVVAPDGHVWVNINSGVGRMEVLASGDTVHFKPIYCLDPETGQHASFSPIEVLTFPDGTVDSLTAESENSGSGYGIALDADGHILSSHYKTLYKINYMTGEGVAMFVADQRVTEAAADDNGNIFLGSLYPGPMHILDSDLNFVTNAIDSVHHINRSIVVTGDGMDMFLGSTWSGHGFSHWYSDFPGAVEYAPMDTFGIATDIPACWEYVNSGSSVPAGAPGDSAYVYCPDADMPDTVFAETAIWASALDLHDNGTLVVGALTSVWGGPLGGTNWVFDLGDEDGPEDPVGRIGNWHNEDGTGEGISDGPRGVSWDADGNMYVADFYSNAIFHFAADYASIGDISGSNGLIASSYVLKQNYPNPFNPTTNIQFEIPASDFVSITVFDIEGRKIKTLMNEYLNAGTHSLNWNGTNDLGVKVSTGMYIYQLRTNSIKLSRTMTFVK